MTNSQQMDSLRGELVRDYGVDPSQVRVVFAPYRVCPLGAHIDHQGGQVTAMAINRGVLFAYASLPNAAARVRSRDFAGEVEFRFDQVPERRKGDWGNFLRGAVRALQQREDLHRGLVGIASGSVSEGGLSSSAAVGVAYLLALEDVNQLQVTAAENVRLGQSIENAYLGLQSGVLDQAAILFSRRGSLTRIECESLRHERIPAAGNLPPMAILIAFSGLQQALVGTNYNQRVAECADAARVLLGAVGRPSAPARLGQLTAREYATHRHRLQNPAALRAEHFFSEMDRVRRGIAAWQSGNLVEFGRLVTASGESSIHNYECGAPPLIDLHRLLVECDGVYGARFSGAGFRGCCLALIDPDKAEHVTSQVQRSYHQLHPDLAQHACVMICESDDGARPLNFEF